MKQFFNYFLILSTFFNLFFSSTSTRTEIPIWVPYIIIPPYLVTTKAIRTWKNFFKYEGRELAITSIVTTQDNYYFCQTVTTCYNDEATILLPNKSFYKQKTYLNVSISDLSTLNQSTVAYKKTPGLCSALGWTLLSLGVIAAEARLFHPLFNSISVLQ